MLSLKEVDRWSSEQLLKIIRNKRLKEGAVLLSSRTLVSEGESGSNVQDLLCQKMVAKWGKDAFRSRSF